MAYHLPDGERTRCRPRRLEAACSGVERAGDETLARLQRAGFRRSVPADAGRALWALDGGADELGAGLVNTVLMLFTVIAQLSMGTVLARLGWSRTLAVGSGLLGLPALGHLLTDHVGAIASLAAVRGLGFGILTVCGATAVAALVEPARRGRAVGAYGLAVAVPQCLLVPIAPWLAERVGFWLVFVCAAVPSLAIPLAPRVARALHGRDGAPGAPADRKDDARRGLFRVLIGPIAALLAITTAGGAILTFTPACWPTLPPSPSRCWPSRRPRRCRAGGSGRSPTAGAPDRRSARCCSSAPAGSRSSARARRGAPPRPGRPSSWPAC
ncbi:MFS transporter [Streptomyces mexicanus]